MGHGTLRVSFTRWLISCALLAVTPPLPAQVAPPPTTPRDARKKPEIPLTKEQAKQLFQSVDEILKFSSSDSNLPIQHSVKRKLISRSEVTRYLTKKFDEDESTKRMERAELVLKKFGLLDREFQLRPFLLSLLTEQIAGFYDNKTKTVNLLDWIEPEEQKSVLAHELTHALQDQRVDLEKWGDTGAHGAPHNVAEDNRFIRSDEADTARSAVAEGQAMAVFLDYTLRGTGHTLADVPGAANRLKDAAPDDGSPVLARAPLLLQQSLLFPYSEGLAFEQAVLVKSGKDAAFAGVLANPPSSSFEIMHPDAYLEHAPVPMLQMPDIHSLLDAEYTPYDIGVMGELDVRILIELFGGREMATALSPAWNGGIYYATQRKSAQAAPERQSTASIGLLYLSKWKNTDSAKSFVKVYSAELPRKYTSLKRRSTDETDGEQIYTTEEGDVLLSISSDAVFVAEGYPLPLARKLRQSLLDAQPSGPTFSTSNSNRTVTHGELSLALFRLFTPIGATMRPDAQRYTQHR